MDSRSTTEPSGAEGRLLYLAEHLTSLHASPDMPWLAGRFEFLGEKALGASLTVLALADESGMYRALQPAGRRPANARALWEEFGIAALASNRAAAGVFAQVERQAGTITVAVAGLFPNAASPSELTAIVVPVSHSRELMGVGVFIVEASELNEAMALILGSHAAVAIHQIRQREEARRLRSVDPKLWVPDEGFLLAQLRRELSRARRYGRELGVTLLRFENEPEVRRQFGDFFTDHLLRRLGSQLIAHVRDSDVLGALGGGYAIIHNETSFEGTEVSANRLREVVMDMVRQRFPQVPAPVISLTVAAYPRSGETLEALLSKLGANLQQGVAV